MNNKQEILGWTMYDWANSAFSTTVVTTFLGPYLTALARENGGFVNFLGFPIEAAAFFPFCVSVGVILQVLVLPILGALADYSNLKKSMLLGFAYTGAIATILLFLIDARLVVLGGMLFIIANLSFGAAIVFYNAFLPEIATPDRRDTVSSRGFAMGYLGGGLLLLLNLLLVQAMDDTALAVRISLASAGVWWLVFTFLFPQQRLVRREAVRQLAPGEGYFGHSLRQVFNTSKEMFTHYPSSLQYLIAYLIYNDGIQTVIVVSTLFASDELGIPTTTLIQVVLMIQFVAFFGALFFDFLAARLGTKNAIMLNLVVWAGVVIYAWLFLYTAAQFWVLGAVSALILGGSQALSRSLFSQMIPADREAEYFSFYEISERGTSWIGPLVFGVAVQLTGTQRIAIVSLIIFFVVGLVLLFMTDVKKAIREAGNEVPARL